MLRDRTIEDHQLLNSLLLRALRELHVQHRREVRQWIAALFGTLSPKLKITTLAANVLRARLRKDGDALARVLERLVLRYVEVAAAQAVEQLARIAMQEGIGSAEQWFLAQQRAAQERPRRIRAQARGVVQLPIARAADQIVQQAELAVDAALAAGETLEVFQLRVETRAESHWWRTARISRTAITFAFNDARVSAVESVQVPELWLRWTELVDDATGQPLDDRVAADSLALHGQLARPGGLFTQPPAPNVPKEQWFLRWAHPPNRPNDRAVLTLWAAGHGVPAWVWEGGQRRVVE